MLEKLFNQSAAFQNITNVYKNNAFVDEKRILPQRKARKHWAAAIVRMLHEC